MHCKLAKPVFTCPLSLGSSSNAEQQVYRDTTDFRLRLEKSYPFQMLSALQATPDDALPQNEAQLREFAKRFGVLLMSMAFVHEVPRLLALLRSAVDDVPATWCKQTSASDTATQAGKGRVHGRQTVAVVLHNGGLVVVHAPYLQDLQAWHYAKTKRALRGLSYQKKDGEVGVVQDEAGYAEAMCVFERHTPVMVAHV